MKKFKKLFLIIGIIAVLSVMFVVTVSADGYDFVSNGESYEYDSAYQYLSSSDQYGETQLFYFHSGMYYAVQPIPFQQIVDYCLSDTTVSYENWQMYCMEHMNDTGDSFLQYWGEEFPGLDEDYFNKLYNYKEITQEDLVTEFNKGVQSQEELIKSLQDQIKDKDVAIETLGGEKTVLESDVAGLNMQVADLVQDKAQLNASIKSLEKQLQIKIDKAYAEGLVDSEGGLTTSGIISIFAVVLTIGELIALVVFFVSKAKKRKHRWNY